MAMREPLLRMHHTHGTLIDQFRHFPKADHDDGPDAVHILWELATKGFYTIAEDTIRTARHAGVWSDTLRGIGNDWDIPSGNGRDSLFGGDWDI